MPEHQDLDLQVMPVTGSANTYHISMQRSPVAAEQQPRRIEFRQGQRMISESQYASDIRQRGDAFGDCFGAGRC